jgi:hypothetical protein
MRMRNYYVSEFEEIALQYCAINNGVRTVRFVD